jgi:hypothetical protein
LKKDYAGFADAFEIEAALRQRAERDWAESQSQPGTTGQGAKNIPWLCGVRTLLRLVCDTAALRRRAERDCAESQSQRCTMGRGAKNIP